MGQRKFNIFKEKYNDVTKAMEKIEVALDKAKKYKLDRKGNIVEYDETEIETEKEAALASLEQQKAAGSITVSEYNTQKIEIEKDNALDRVISEVADDELVFTGSKSDIRKGEISERNISVLQSTKVDVLNLRYDIAFFSPNDQPMNETLFSMIAPVELSLSANLGVTEGTAVTYEGFVVADYIIMVKHNGTDFGTITIRPNGDVEIASPELILSKGDTFSYHSPDVYEADLSDVSVMVAANQTVK